jgi:hypothetical protein
MAGLDPATQPARARALIESSFGFGINIDAVIDDAEKSKKKGGHAEK